MASSTNTKEPDISQCTSIFLKKKTSNPGSLTRTRFSKPRPNIGALAIKTSSKVVLPKERVLDQRDGKSSVLEVTLPSIETPVESLNISLEKEIPSSSCTATQQKNSDENSSNLRPSTTPEKECLNTTTPCVESVKDTPIRSEIHEPRITKESLSIPEVNETPDSSMKNLLNCSTKRLICEKTSKPRKKIASACETSPDSGSTINCEPLPNRVIAETLQTNITSDEECIDDPSPYANENNIADQRCENSEEVTSDKESSPAVVNGVTENPVLKNISNSPRKRIVSRKVRKKNKRFSKSTGAPPRNEMKMFDLICYNPNGTPMKYANSETNVAEEASHSENSAPVVEQIEEEDNDCLRPRVIIENGEIVVDNSSLVIRRKESSYQLTSAVVENDNTTYSSFRKPPAKKWTFRETIKFYKALSSIGTDFALMEKIFKEDWKIAKSRHDLKLKFKLEERHHPKVVYRAMYKSQGFDIDVLKDDSDDIVGSSEEEDEPPKLQNNAESDEMDNKQNEREKGESSSTDNSTTNNNQTDKIDKQNGTEERESISTDNSTTDND